MLSGVRVVSISLAVSVGIGSESVHRALHFHTHFQEGQLKRQEGDLRTSNVPLGPQSPPSSPKSPGCRSRSGPGGPVVATPASSCSSSQRWTRARTRALVGTPLRRLWRRRRAWTPSSRRTDTDFRKGPISAGNPTRADLHPPLTTRARGGGARFGASDLASECLRRKKYIHSTAVASRTGFGPESRQADSNRFLKLITSDNSRVAGACTGLQIPHN